MRRTGTIIFFVVLCTIFITVTCAADKHQIIVEEEFILACDSEDGVCEPPNETIQKIISYDVDSGLLTLNSQQIYSKPFRQYGIDVAQHLGKIVKNIQSLELLAGANNFDRNLDMIIQLTNNLSFLAAVHKEEWLYGSFDDTTILESKGFDNTLAVCKTIMRLYNLLKMHTTIHNENEIGEYISTGIASAALLIGDLFQLRPSIDPTVVIEDDYSTAYQYFSLAGITILNSLESMGLDKYGDNIAANGEHTVDEMYLLVLEDILTVHASVNLRLGSLLIDSHLLGLVLSNDHFSASRHTPDQNVSSPFEVSMQQLSESQKRILRKAYDNLETSVLVCKKIRPSGEIQIIQPDAYSRMAIINSLLQEWSLAVENCQSGLSILSVSVNEEKGSSVEEIVEIMITITQSLFEAYLHLPDETEPAKDAFRKHLLARQAAEVGDFRDVFGKELTNEDEERVRQILLKKDSIQPPVDNEQLKESLHLYQSMLEEVSQLHYLELDINGGSADEVRDTLYEGSLRSVIGSILLDLNEPWKAKDELENAVLLLEEGIGLVDSGQFEVILDDGKPLAYSLRLELASVLQSLSYTYLALMQWESSYNIFELALDIFHSELPEGESPMEWGLMATTKASARDSASITERLLSYFFTQSGNEVDTEDNNQLVNITA